ncbi:MAG TPA: arylsulfatase [Actinopolymorphaceae bacterium]
MAEPRTCPNVVVILADDMGWGDLGCFGATRIPTPRMDAIAAAGVRLTNCHSASAVCTPSRYALLTGRYAWRGALKQGVLAGHSPPILEPGRPTLASVLHDEGYATAAIGKWHLGLGWQWKDGSRLTAFGPDAHLQPTPLADYGADVDYTQPFADGPTEHGFDRFFGIAGSLDMPPYAFLDQDRTFGVPDREKEVYVSSQRAGRQTPGWRDDQVDIRFVTEACRWVRAQEQPFLLYLTLASPHYPCTPPDFIRGRSDAGSRGDMVTLVDWAVGQIDDTLADIGVTDDTLLIVTSDNGAMYADFRSPDTHGHSSNGPWRGQKADIWDGGHREPFVARWPAAIPAGLERDDPVCLVDLLPTIATAVGTGGRPDAEDGRDILDVLTGAADIDGERVLIHHSLHGMFAVRRGPWKAVFGTGSGGFTIPAGDLSDDTGQLYDLAADPAEAHNLWAEHPDVVAELRRELDPTPDPRLATT